MGRVLNTIKEKIHKGSERSVRAKKSILRMFINKGLSVVFSMMYVPLLLDCIDKTRYGIWLAIMNVIHWVAFMDIGIGHGLRNLLSESLAKNNQIVSKKLVSTAYVSVGIIFSIVILIFIFVYPLVDWYKIVKAPLNLQNEVNLLILVALCLMCVNLVLSILNSVLYAFQKSEKISEINLVTQGLSLLTVYCFYLEGGVKTLLPICITMSLLPCIVNFVYTLYFFLRKFKYVSPSIMWFDIKYVKHIMALGGGFFFIQMSNMLCFFSNDILISNIMSPDVVVDFYVIYKYASVVLVMFLMISSPLWSATTEAYVKGDIQWIKNAERRLLKVWCGFVVIVFVMNLVSPIFFNIWLKNKVEIDMIAVVMVFVYILLQMFSNIYLTFINGMGKIRLQLIIFIVMPFIYLPMVGIFGNSYGIKGFISAGIIVLVVHIVAFYTQYNKIINAKETEENSIWFR